MYNVIIIDDEKWSIESLRRLIDWSVFGFNVVSTFTSSEKALSYIQCNNVDVVFIDIRIPEMSGIDFITKWNKISHKKIYFVIVSGYGEFNYAQQALKLGAYDYKLKPVDTNDLEQLLLKLKKELDSSSITSSFLLYEKIIDTECDHQLSADLLGYNELHDYWQAFVLLDFEADNCFDFNFSSKNINCTVINLGYAKKIIILNGNTDNFDEFKEYLECTQLDKKLKIGCSVTGYKISNIVNLIMQAEYAAYDYYIYLNKSIGLSFYEKKSITPIKELISNISGLIINDKIQLVLDIIDELPDFIRNHHFGIQQVLSIYNETMYIIKTHNNESDIYYYNCTQFTNNFKSLLEMCDFLKNKIIFMFNDKYKTEEKENYVNTNFKKIMDYVNKNYNKQISLKELSEKYFLSFTYCCHLFKNYTNMTFREYVNQLRMANALKLLRTGKYTVEYVSYYVGYNDQYYFTRRFKRHYGFNPSQANIQTQNQ